MVPLILGSGGIFVLLTHSSIYFTLHNKFDLVDSTLNNKKKSSSNYIYVANNTTIICLLEFHEKFASFKISGTEQRCPPFQFKF
jgi:hypothetical protein